MCSYTCSSHFPKFETCRPIAKPQRQLTSTTAQVKPNTEHTPNTRSFPHTSRRQLPNCVFKSLTMSSASGAAHLLVKLLVVTNRGDADDLTHSDICVSLAQVGDKASKQRQARGEYRKRSECYSMCTCVVGWMCTGNSSGFTLLILCNIVALPGNKSRNLPSGLRSALREAEEWMSKALLVALQVNTYPYHDAVQIVLDNCVVLSYVFSDEGDLTKVYTDTSCFHYVKRRCTTAIIRSNKIMMGLHNGGLVAMVNSQRNKSKR